MTACSALQHCPPGRFLSLLVGAGVLYLSSYTPLRRWLERLAGLQPPAAAPAAAVPGGGAPAGAAYVAPVPGTHSRH